LTRTALFLAYHFPPAGGPGVQRSAKFVKYLPAFGWQAAVLTATEQDHPVLDQTLVSDIPPQTPIYRVRAHDIQMLRPQFERLKLGKLLSAINAALYLPDTHRLWSFLARSTARRAIEAEQPALVYSTSAPFSAHLLGFWVHKTFGLPWVADFRDPWSEDDLLPYYPGYRALNRAMERRVLLAADHIITVSEPLVEMFARLSGRPRQDITLIENGYDEDDVPALPPPRTERFTITYTGEFSRVRLPDTFIAAVDSLVQGGAIPVDELRVAFAGKNTAKFVPDRPPFEQLGYLDHTSLVDLRRASDLLLLIQHDSYRGRGNFGGKFYEYLGSNRPTLAITGPDNAAAERLTAARAGTAVRHDTAEIASVILDYYRQWKQGVFEHSPDWNIIRQSTRRNQTRSLADVFEAVMR
jgi:glycosyltransferase involved in cell wall biosynthesis